MNNDSIKTSDNAERHFYRASTADFKKIPGSPIAYWIPNFEIFNFSKIDERWFSGGRIKTHDGQRFIRYSWEVSRNSDKWKRLIKGGDFRKHFGNEEFLADWSANAISFYEERGGLYPEKFREKQGICWSKITSAAQSFRIKREITEYDSASPTIFNSDFKCDTYLLALLNSSVVQFLLKAINPTINTQVADVMAIPVCGVSETLKTSIQTAEKCLINISSSDWDSYETSWDFTELPLLSGQPVGRVSDSVTRQPEAAGVGLRDKAANPTYSLPLSIKGTYTQLRAHWQEMTLEMQHLEQENNRIFIDAYGLQDELTPEVPLNEITLTCNPWYRYGKTEPRINTNEHEKEKNISVNSCSFVVQKNFPVDEELEAKLLADTLKEFISYAVGCMFGRYSLDKPGLILANQGETIKDYYKKLQEPRIDTNGHEKENQPIRVNSCSLVVQNSFEPDADNVIPMLDGDWFTDDITDHFCKFLKVTFGEEHYQENLTFIEKALGKDIRKYFLKDFYNDHVRRYKKRPIYWLFSSPKGTFNALIYMHRYRPDTVSVVLNDYLREFRTKLSAHKNHLEAVSISGSASAGEKTKALKEIEIHRKMIDELDSYERKVLYPLATEQLELDLDDGVKVNYQKFGEALKKIPGLAAKED